MLEMEKANSKALLRTAVEALRSDLRLRTEALLYFSLAVNLTHAVLHAVNGAATRSLWSGMLAFYHLTLSAIRFSLLLGCKKASILQKWKRYRSSAFVMLVLIVVLFGIQYVTLYMGHAITYPGYMIYAIAAYTFYMAIVAVRNVVIYRKCSDPILSASKALALTVAAISVYSLQSAMISAFGNSEPFRTRMGTCVGAGVFLLIASLSVSMIVKGTKALRHAAQE